MIKLHKLLVGIGFLSLLLSSCTNSSNNSTDNGGDYEPVT